VTQDLLFVFAEVGIAFAGFAGLVTVLAARARQSSVLELLFLNTVLATSLSAVTFSLLPPSLVGMGLDADIALRVCAALFLAASIGYGSWAAPRASAAYKTAGATPPWTWRLNIGLAFGQWILLALCALGFVSSSLYIGALFFFLYLAGSSFFRVFASVGRDTWS
jgi:hypothetical protein